MRCEERFTWTYSDLDSQVLHFDIFRIRRCDITFIIFVPSSTVLTEMSFDRPVIGTTSHGVILSLFLCPFMLEDLKEKASERNAKKRRCLLLVN